MVVTSEYVSIVVDGSPMRALVTSPRARQGLRDHDADDRRYPAIVLYSDIFQLTGPQIRMSTRLAGYGFVVVTPEIYHRVEAPGTAIPFDDEGRVRGQRDAATTTVGEFDADLRAALAYLESHPRVRADRLGVAGFCTGGHLAFRGALDPRVRSTVCFYPTGLHDGKLGKDADAGTLARVSEIRGELLLVFGTLDPHIPEAARATVQASLARAGTRVTTKLYAAEHAFMRDEGPRYDPEATDDAWREAMTFLRASLAD